MPPHPYMVKTLQISYSLEQKANGLGTWFEHCGCGLYQVCTNDEPSMTYFMSRSNVIPNAFIWGKS